MAYANFWKRVAADLIDLTIYFILWIIIILTLGILATFIPMPDLLQTLVVVIVSIACYLYYFVYTESSHTQATWGKQLFGLKVTDLAGKRVSFLRSLGRNLGALVSILTLGIGYLMCLWTQQKQCLHDKMENCLIIDKSPQRKQTGLVWAVISIYALIMLAIMGVLIYFFTTLLPQLEQDIIRDNTTRHVGRIYPPAKDLTPLMKASSKGDSKQVAQLIQQGADLNATDYCGRTALFFAIRWNKLDTVKLLLTAGANVNVLETKISPPLTLSGACMGESPLMHAVYYGASIDIIQALLDAGADVNPQTTTGGTALSKAKARANETKKSLEFAEKDVQRMKREIEKREEIIRLLKQAGARE